MLSFAAFCLNMNDTGCELSFVRSSPLVGGNISEMTHTTHEFQVDMDHHLDFVVH